MPPSPGTALPASRFPRSCPPSSLPPSGGKLPAHAATFPRASTSSAPRRLSSSLLAGGAAKGPRGQPDARNGSLGARGSGRGGGRWAPDVPTPAIDCGRPGAARPGPGACARAAGSHSEGPGGDPSARLPAATPLPPAPPLQPPASAAGCPAFGPLPRRARPRLLGAPYLLSGPSPGRGWAAARPREPCRRLPLALPPAVPRADRSGSGVCRKRKITPALETQPRL